MSRSAARRSATAPSLSGSGRCLETRACLAGTVPCRAVEADEAEISVPRTPLRSGTPSAGDRRPRPRGRGRAPPPGVRARGCSRDLASCAPGSNDGYASSTGRARRSRPGATRVPYLGSSCCHSSRAPGGCASTAAAIELLVPGEPSSARPRSSAGTGAPRTPRSRRGWTGPARQPGSVVLEAHDPRPADALGKLLAVGRDELQLAAAAGARAGARLRRLARGLPSGGDGPLAAVLGAARVALPGLPRPRAVAAASRGDARPVEVPIAGHFK